MDCWKYCKGYKFALSVARPRAIKLSASGGLRLWPPDQGLCPWTPLGALSPTTVIGSRPRARHVPPENCPWPPRSSTLAPSLPVSDDVRYQRTTAMSVNDEHLPRCRRRSAWRYNVPSLTSTINVVDDCWHPLPVGQTSNYFYFSTTCRQNAPNWRRKCALNFIF